MRAPGQVTLFDYSEAEWSNIEIAVQPIRNGPLPKRTRECLVGEARWYLAAKDYPTKGGHEHRAWRKIADQAESLLQAISALTEEHLKLLERAGYKKNAVERLHRFYSSEFGALSGIRDGARELASLNERCPTEAAHYDNPKMMYEFKVLSIWTDLGGALRRSRHPRTRKIQGPLVRFFRAVTVPVMGASAPSPESLPDIIRRQKRFIAFEKGVNPKLKELLSTEFGPREDHRAKLD